MRNNKIKMTPSSEMPVLINPETTLEQDWKGVISAFFILERKKFNIALILIASLLGGCGGLLLGDYTIYNSFHLTFFEKLIDISSSLLGFAIAGYALFALLGDKDYLILLMKNNDEKNGGLPYFKVHILYYVKFMLSLCLSLAVFWLFHTITSAQQNQWYIIPYFSGIFQIGGLFFGSISGFLVGLVFVEIKAFIFNIYCMSLTHAIFQHNKFVIDSSK